MIKNLGGFTGGKNFRSKSELKRKAIQKKDIPGSSTGDVNSSYSPPHTKKTAKKPMNLVKRKTKKNGKSMI